MLLNDQRPTIDESNCSTGTALGDHEHRELPARGGEGLENSAAVHEELFRGVIQFHPGEFISRDPEESGLSGFVLFSKFTLSGVLRHGSHQPLLALEKNYFFLDKGKYKGDVRNRALNLDCDSMTCHSCVTLATYLCLSSLL